MNKKGFTLVELLAVVVILAIILAIAVPTIRSMVETSKRNALDANAKMVLKAIKIKLMEDNTISASSFDESNITSLNLSNQNVEDLVVSEVQGKPYVYLKGKNQWAGYTACGEANNMEVFDSGFTTDCLTYKISYTGNSTEFQVTRSGNYKIELWGASGGGDQSPAAPSHAGLGGYVNGEIYLTAGQQLYVYVGGAGKYASINNYGWNGGGAAGNATNSGGGGGATDIRLASGDWNSSSSLYSRIIVAGAGGGADNSGGIYNGGDDGSGGAGGGLDGENAKISGVYATNTNGTQTVGAIGIGSKATVYTDTGGGGSGYRGGYSTNNNNGGGGGGSSFISGHNGCDAVNSSGVNTGSANHYSGFSFTNTVMIDGNGYAWTNVKGAVTQMPKPDGTFYASGLGHTGNGYAKITYLGE